MMYVYNSGPEREKNEKNNEMLNYKEVQDDKSAA